MWSTDSSSVHKKSFAEIGKGFFVLYMKKEWNKGANNRT